MGDIQLLTFDDIPEEIFTRWDITGHQVNQHLLSGSLTGTPEIVADLFTFPPGFIHHMHRHPYADMILVPLSGTLQFVGEFAHMLEIRSGQVFVVPRGNWHEFEMSATSPAGCCTSSAVWVRLKTSVTRPTRTNSRLRGESHRPVRRAS